MYRIVHDAQTPIWTPNTTWFRVFTPKINLSIEKNNTVIEPKTIPYYLCSYARNEANIAADKLCPHGLPKPEEQT